MTVRSLDRESLLVEAAGDVSLADVERVLRVHDLTLDLSVAFAGTVAEWLATGAPGARSPWLDPADHLLAGITARLDDGRELVVRPAPRRAVGPDVVALFFGMGERYGKITTAWLRVHRVGAPRPTEPFRETDIAIEPSERALWDAIAAELEG